MPRDSLAQFRRVIWAHYKKHGRHDLPWRRTRDTYKILVSEVMLQQTQVERVVPLYRAFLKKFPTAQALVDAPLADVLRAWQGLGYNRRAKLLREAARVLANGGVPRTVAELERLPGVGPYTARAVAVFAWNRDAVVIETNIRTAILEHFFPEKEKVSDAEIEKILGLLTSASIRKRPREWYSALMDYGAHLKRAGVKRNAQSVRYAKQSKFEGSVRQVRGAIVTALAKRAPLAKVRAIYPDRFETALASLVQDGLVRKRGRSWQGA